MIRILGFLLCVYLWQHSFGQDVESITLDSAVFSKSVQMSSLAVKDDVFYSVAEKCKRLYVFNSRRLIQSIDLNTGAIKGDGKVEIEAIVLIGAQLLMLDEGKLKVYQYDLNKNTLSVVHGANLSEGDKGKMEGLAVDAKGKTCYIVKENDGNGKSEIRIHELSDGSLKYLNTIYVQHDDIKDRYSDACFNYGKLYCLKSRFYGKRSSQNKYWVEVLTLNNKKGAVEEREVIDITKKVTEYEMAKGLNSNLEGITVDEQGIYIISDNCWGAYPKCDCDNKAKEGTMFLKVTSNKKAD